MVHTVAAAGLAAVGISLGTLVVGDLAADPPHTSAAGVPSRTSVIDYAAPLPQPLRVSRGFDPPADPYGPGHLGVDLRTGRGAQVEAAGDGVVQFAGSVAGRGVVVVLHADGVSTEYEPLHVLVRVGQLVRRGEQLGQLAGRHRGCTGWCLHWGARRGGAYLDPLLLLRPLGPVRLLPWRPDG